MATSTMYFPNGLYPQSYTPPIAGYDYNPSLGELLDLDTATTLSRSTTQQVLQLANGLKAKLIGTGLTYDASGDAVSGTLTAIQIFLNDGTTLVQQLTGINRPVQNVGDAAAAFNAYDFNEWLMSGNDLVNGSTGDDDLFGFAGNDVLNGGDGSDYMEGGSGDDTYNGGNGFDVLSFQDAYFDRTVLRGIDLNATSQTVVDPWGNTETFTSMEGFRGTQFADVMVGSAGDEEFMGLGGRDTIDGAGGIDTIRFDRDERRGGTSGVTVNLGTGVAIDGFGRQDSLRNIENIRATEAADGLVGSAVANRIRAFGGNDSLNGGLGADDLRGGAGNDAYGVDNLGDVVNELDDAGSGVDQVISSVGFNLGSSQTRGVVENLTLTGTAAINGTGNAVANLLVGNAGTNGLAGLAGNDRLIGGLGLDTLAGGSEVDTFVFAATADSGIGASLADRIADHVAGEKIDVSLIDANSVAAGNQAFVLDINASFSIGEIRQTKSGAHLLLDFNTDADAAAEMSILLLNHGAVTASDFVF